MGAIADMVEQDRDEWRAEAQRLKGMLTKIAAECHRAKWQFDLSEDYKPSAAAARALIVKGFEELHRIGDWALANRNYPTQQESKT